MALALRHAAPLKPGIQLAQAPSEYEAILTVEEKAKFRTWRGHPPTVNDGMRTTGEVDRESGS